MARLQLKTTGFEGRIVELKPGINRLGRAAHSDVQLEHPTVSADHCQIQVGCGPVSVRDCNSTNGTFVDGTPIQDALLLQGQTLRLGDLEFLVADTDISISIPRFEVPIAAPPVMLSNGSVICRQHQFNQATYQCTHCHELLCEECLHRLRRRGGNLLRLCPLCSYPVEVIGGGKKKKRSLLNRLCETTRLFFSWAATRN